MLLKSGEEQQTRRKRRTSRRFRNGGCIRVSPLVKILPFRSGVGFIASVGGRCGCDAQQFSPQIVDLRIAAKSPSLGGFKWITNVNPAQHLHQTKLTHLGTYLARKTNVYRMPHGICGSNLCVGTWLDFSLVSHLFAVACNPSDTSCLKMSTYISSTWKGHQHNMGLHERLPFHRGRDWEASVLEPPQGFGSSRSGALSGGFHARGSG